jgi:hypothetical protein
VLVGPKGVIRPRRTEATFGSVVTTLRDPRSRDAWLRHALAVAFVALLSCALAGPAAAWQRDAAVVRAGLARAEQERRLAAIEAHEYRGDLAAAARLIRDAGPRSPVAAALHDVAAQARRYDGPRALALFRTLRLNTRLYAAGRGAHENVVADADGVAYRTVPSGGVRFHPLASFGNLNRVAADRDYRATIRLAYALLARARSSRDELVWEYQYPFAGGAAPWTSGLAQAVAAQALARAGFVEEARRAYRPIPKRLLLRLPQGRWVRLYEFSGAAVLNAQLQAAVSLEEYGRRARDPGARRLARELRQSAAALLPRFDTGSWSLYALGGGESTLAYHTYVTSLLWKLSSRTGDAQWARWAARLRDQWRKPPRVTLRRPARAAIPLPEDGFRDWAEIPFHLSKPATVTVAVAGERLVRRLEPGNTSIWWRPGTARKPGAYGVRVTAVDRVGNRSDRSLPPVTIERDRRPPALAASLSGRLLTWRARDAGTPWLTLQVRLSRGGTVVERRLARTPLQGQRELDIDDERRWHATLVASDSTGNRTLLPLGHVGPDTRFPATT